MIEIFIGFLISFFIAITGMGAGTITAPVMILFLNIEPAIAIGTALVFSLLVKVPIGISYGMKKLVDFPLLASMSLGGIPGVVTGSFLLRKVSEADELRAFIFIGVGLVVLVSALLNLYLIARKKDISRKHEAMKKWIPFFTFIIGLEVGFSSAGAGAMGTILILYVTNLESKRVVATDILFGLILSAAGGGIHFSMGHVNMELLILLISGGLFGALFGIYFSSKISPKKLKTLLLITLLFVSSQLIYRGWNLL